MQSSAELKLTRHLKEPGRGGIVSGGCGRCRGRHATNRAVHVGIQQITVDALGESGATLGHLLCVHDLLGLGFLALDALLVYLVVVYLAHLVHDVLVLERDKAEAAVTLRRLVKHQHGVVDLAVLVEVILDVVRRRLGRQAAHKYLLGSCDHLFVYLFKI
jgi:hypothetical protein